MFVDFSDSKLVIDLKKVGDSVKASYCLHAAFNVYTDAAPQDVMRHAHILRVLK